MNTYSYNEITIGQEESFTVKITDADMEAFHKTTGDDNPLHCNAEYAMSRGYDGRLVYGMLTASYLSTLAGMYLPGERSVIYEVEVKFIKPLVFQSNSNSNNNIKLTVCGKVAKKNDKFNRIIIKLTITNEDGEKVLRGTMKVGVAE